MSTGWLPAPVSPAIAESSAEPPGEADAIRRERSATGVCRERFEPPGATTSQHAAFCVFGTEAVIDMTRVPPRIAYAEAAELAASDTTSSPTGVNENPKGEAPFGAP